MDVGGYQIVDFHGINFTGKFISDNNVALSAITDSETLKKLKKRLGVAATLSVPVMFSNLTVTVASKAGAKFKDLTVMGYHCINYTDTLVFICMTHIGTLTFKLHDDSVETNIELR